MFERKPEPSMECLRLPPRPSQSADFEFLLRQFPCVKFQSEDGSLGILAFGPRHRLTGGGDSAGQYCALTHTLFLVKDGKAHQLELEKPVDTSTTYFTARCRGLDGTFSVSIERDFDRLILRDSTGTIAETLLSEVDMPCGAARDIRLIPLSARPRLILHHEPLGFICFTFERAGAYPMVEWMGLPRTVVRGFIGGPDHWREMEVGSTILAGRGLHNLTVETEIGTFFVPGPASIGPAVYAPTNGVGVDIEDFDTDILNGPVSSQREQEAIQALRRLGLPEVPPW